MHVAVACGGTGGHIFPGLATAAELKRRGHKVTLWLAGKDVEHEAVKGWEGEIVTVPAQGFPSKLNVSAIKTGFKLLGAIFRVKADMSKDRPDVVVAMGSYASIGPGFAAIILRIPLVLHESNVIPGRAVRLLSKGAKVIACCFDETRFYLRRRELTITGMPLRAEIVKASASAIEKANPSDHFRFLVMGGSRGAHKLNQLVTQAMIQLHHDGTSVAVTHLTGEQDESTVQSRYAEAGVIAEVCAFTRNIGSLYNEADFAVCRAGAATCAELSTFGLPALLIPYPYAVKDHQTANARAMEKAGAADMVPERDLTVDWLVGYVRQTILNKERRSEMSIAARERSSMNGAQKLATLIEQQTEKSGHE